MFIEHSLVQRPRAEPQKYRGPRMKVQLRSSQLLCSVAPCSLHSEAALRHNEMSKTKDVTNADDDFLLMASPCYSL